MTVVYKLKSSQGNPIHIRHPNANGNVPSAALVPNLRCPHCMHMGAFSAAIQNDLQINHQELKAGALYNNGMSTVGIRVCPNFDCRGIVLVVMTPDGKVIALPNEVLDFDPKDIPPSIAASLEEAIKCHSAQCYKAAALMVRRVLEEVCKDQGATGTNLKERIAALAKIIVIPQELLAAADHLRLLGNDAAHIEAQVYQSIGENEVRLAVDLAKELLKGVYQYKGLLAQLKALQSPP